MKRVAIVVLLTGCAPAPAPAPPSPPAGFEKEFAAAVETVRSSAAYSVWYEIHDGVHTVKGRTQRFRGDVLKILREVKGASSRHLEVGDRHWWIPDGGSAWGTAPSSLRGTLEDPESVLKPLGAAVPRWVRQETIGEYDCRVVELDVELPSNRKSVARAWYHREGLEKIEIEAPRLRMTMQIGGVRSSLRLMAEDEPAPWSDDMKAAASKAVEEKKR